MQNLFKILVISNYKLMCYTGRIFPTAAMTKINENDNKPPTAEISFEIYPSFKSDNPGLNGFT